MLCQPYLFTNYLYRTPSRYLLRGAQCTGLYDVKCHYGHYERIIIFNQLSKLSTVSNFQFQLHESIPSQSSKL